MTMFLSPYAEYVWASYAISAVAIGATVIFTLHAWRKAKRALEGREKPVEVSETNL
jgi:heme exporter protein CcmD